jgi:hypothetical protein
VPLKIGLVKSRKKLNLTNQLKRQNIESQIIKALMEEELGRSVAHISCELGVHKQIFYNWQMSILV